MDQVAIAIQAVTEDSARIKVMVDEVSLGSEEQSRGIEQIGRAISKMEQVTQTTAATAEESAAAAEELSAQSEALKEVIGRVQSMISGKAEALGSIRYAAPVRSRASVPVFKRATRFAGNPRPMESAQPENSTRYLAAGNRKVAAANEFPMDDNF